MSEKIDRKIFSIIINSQNIFDNKKIHRRKKNCRRKNWRFRSVFLGFEKCKVI